MRVLALDLSSTSGFAWDGPDGRPQFSTLRGKMPEGGMDANFGPLFGALAQHMRDLIAWIGKDGNPEIISVERPFVPLPRQDDEGKQVSTGRPTSPEIVFMLCGMVAVAWTVANAHGIPLRRRAASTARKYFIGIGRQPKGGENIKQIVLRRCYLLTWKPGNDHEGDAGCLWAYEKSLSDRSFVLPPPGMLFSPNRMRVTA